jgi:hypothetical protein
MEFATRLAEHAPGYPLPIAGRARWQPLPGEPGTWETEIKLPVVPADHIIVPSFCRIGSGETAYQFTLHTDAKSFHLNPVPAQNDAQRKRTTPQPLSNPAVSCHIDCWHSHSALQRAVVRLRVAASAAPSNYLLTLSIRPLELNSVPAPRRGARTQVEVPRSISQMQADKSIRARICSPTALAMAMSVFHDDVDWPATVDACYDPLTKAYGAWPLAINAAARHGTLAAVECLYDWADIIAVLQAGSPMVCSIRFNKGELQNAPLPQTGGHLVLLQGIEDDFVLVKDPAADTHGDVSRRYSSEEFSKAWLQRRGAAYIFAVS